MDGVFRALFLISICSLSYLYGVVSMRYQIFPYQPIKDALVAAQALREFWQERLDDKPVGALAFASDMPPPQVLNERAGQELVLVTGAPFELMSECPELGCLAWIMDRDGNVRHVWPVHADEPWGDLAKSRDFAQLEGIFPMGMYLYDNGDLLVSYQARNTYPFSVGMAKFDKDGNLLWKNETLSHHWFSVDDQGLIYTPAHAIIDSPMKINNTVYSIKCEAEKIYEDLILILDPDGKVVRRISVLDSMLKSDYFGLLILDRDSSCDPLHLNDVRLVTQENVSAYPGLAVGDMLISMNAINAVAVLDHETAEVKWLSAGKFSKQHSPRMIGDDSIVVLDNRGGSPAMGGSRIVRMNLASEEIDVLFPPGDAPPETDFYTDVSGHIDVSADRSRALVASTMQGRVLEIDLHSGEVLWDYENVHDVSPIMDAGSDQRYASFGINGAYYVGNPSFLSQSVSAAGAAD